MARDVRLKRAAYSLYREAATCKGIGKPMKMAWKRLNRGGKSNEAIAINLAFIAGKKAGYQEGRTRSRMYRRKKR